MRTAKIKDERYLSYDVYSYFDEIIEGLAQKKILDWGCNHANFLRFCDNPDKVDYCGVDVNPKVIKLCKRLWPDKDFELNKRFNWQYNYGHSSTEWPRLPKSYFDVILSFSVFTHCDFGDLLEHIEAFQRYLAKGGKIYLTIYSSFEKSAFEMIRDFRVSHNYPLEIWEQICGQPTASIYSKNGQAQVIVNKQEIPKTEFDSFYTFYDPQWLCERLGATVHRVKSSNVLLDNQLCLAIS